QATGNSPQVWTLRDGTELRGRVLTWESQPLNLRRSHGTISMNDQPMDSFPADYQRVILQMAAKTANRPISSRHALEQWLAKHHGQSPATEFEGVRMELSNGMESIVPFAFLSKEDEDFLRPGYDHWREEHQRVVDKRRREQERKYAELSLRARAAVGYAQNPYIRQMVDPFYVPCTYFPKWEVMMYPRVAGSGRPFVAFVSAINSLQAMQLATGRYPAYVAGPACLF
ncbi:MAG: hypothetical protein Q4C47_03945, partial [Planctomycetia bacterium]|nr:hypothetical protein [Planctomycetia bacterium]